MRSTDQKRVFDDGNALVGRVDRLDSTNDLKLSLVILLRKAIAPSPMQTSPTVLDRLISEILALSWVDRWHLAYGLWQRLWWRSHPVATQQRRSAPPGLAGQAKIKGDIIGSIVEENEWQCLE